MIIIPVVNMSFVPESAYLLSSEEYKALTPTEPHMGEDILLTFPQKDFPDDISVEPYQSVAIEGKIYCTPNRDSIEIVTGRRVALDFVATDIEDGLPNFELNIQKSDEIYDMTFVQRSEFIESILKKLESYKLSNPTWYDFATSAVRKKTEPSQILSIPPFNILNVDRCYDIVSEDSCARRAELVKSFIDDIVDSNVLDYTLDYIESGFSQKNTSRRSVRPDYAELEAKLNKLKLSDEAAEEVKRTFDRLKNEQVGTSNFALDYDFLKYVADLPWKKARFKTPDLEKTRKILDMNHYGISKVKNRIIQSLAIMALNRKQTGAVMCFVGAPGVGKTSICRSIADSLGRKYARISLGGVSDEAVIRGHRRTYLGSMAGRIINAVMKCGVTNPVIVLDEIDKIGVGQRGDPCAALLEVLDPEQNSKFMDNYLNFPFDLSQVMFIATANDLSTIPEPLLDRMEVIDFKNYTQTEKYHIATEHLLPAALRDAGLPPYHINIPRKTMDAIISGYTYEGGVRTLKQCLDTICRHVATKYIAGEKDDVSISQKKLPEYLDAQPALSARTLDNCAPGIVTGLACNNAGGRILFIESAFVPGSSETKITGQAGDVMRESTDVAVSIVKCRYPDKSEMFEKNKLHIHFPEGATPKDGPSAGIALVSAIASLVTGKSVDSHIAMTGEVSLRGAVTAIGGLEKKLWGAKQAGISTVLIPKDNIRDLKDIPDEVKGGLDIVPVADVDDVLRHIGLESA